MAETLFVELVTPEKIKFQDEALEVVAPGGEGDLGILPRHAPLLTTLRGGEVVIRREEKDYFFSISPGFLEVMNNRVLLLVERAEKPEEIPLEEAMEESLRLEKIMAEEKDGVRYQQLFLKRQEALGRVKVARRLQG